MTRVRMEAAVCAAAGEAEVLRYLDVDLPCWGLDEMLVRVGRSAAPS